MNIIVINAATHSHIVLIILNSGLVCLICINTVTRFCVLMELMKLY